MSQDPNALPKILHEWTISIDKSVDETTTENVNGQMLPVTRKVVKPVATRMALKQFTRRELRHAQMFFDKEFNRFFSMGFVTRSMVVNRHLDLTGGVLSDKERNHAQKLATRHIEVEQDLARSVNEPKEVKDKLHAELTDIRTQLSNLNAANESVFSHTADAKAQSQLSTWFALFGILIERGGKLVPFFEGETYEAREEFMFKLEETNDEFYLAATDKIATVTYWFNRGADTPEAFRQLEEELKKQLEAAKAAKLEQEEKEKAERLAAKPVTEPTPIAVPEPVAAAA